jgi:myosin heavy subunit
MYFQVVYESYGFLEKNRDRLPDGGMELMRTSTVGLAQLIFLGQCFAAVNQ